MVERQALPRADLGFARITVVGETSTRSSASFKISFQISVMILIIALMNDSDMVFVNEA